MGDPGDLLETAAVDLIGKLKRAAEEAGYTIQAPAVQAALLEMGGHLITSVCLQAIAQDIRGELRAWRHGRGEW